ncbi:RNA interference and gene silencing protein [Dactylonectria estremocensis]|uniref:RNA interference and gene silencing protein n=1 Tax=Dactylonectria estremocensis TaxID=1079267 RepID=A0A9P9D9S2_9HYPO|nr:RNA interference and gene silencing protein [Dactylonectria estremocensis]
MLIGLCCSSPAGVEPPDLAITKIEDALQASEASIDLSKLSLQGAFPNRPRYGTKGTSVTLWANYVVLTASSELVLHRYDISVTPAAVGKKLTQITRLLLETPELAPYYRAEGEEEARPGATQYKVQLLLTNRLAAAELTEYLTSTDLSARFDEKLPMIQAFNIFLNHYAKSSGNLATIDSSKSFSLSQQSHTSNLSHCLMAVRGFFTSVRAATARVLVNINVSYGAFYQEGPLDQFILRFGDQKGLFKLEAYLKRLRIRTTHLTEKKNNKGEAIPRIKTIIGLAGKNDGHGLAHPPKVGAFGAGPKDVEFWLDASPPQQSSVYVYGVWLVADAVLVSRLRFLDALFDERFWACPPW